MGVMFFTLMLLSLAIWIYLLAFRGQFWRTNEQLEVVDIELKDLPGVCAVIPARNEADIIAITVRSLLNQDYPGSFNIFLVDDGSTDGTANIALGAAHALGKSSQLQIVNAAPLPPGWTGKLWAMKQGLDKASASAPDYFLLTDADIEHDIANLSRLVAKAATEDLDMVSVMVRLRCQSFWEKLLIPAFVFFFEKLYPFRWVNNPQKKIAAAAGGCILIRREALAEIGGIQAIRQALIDDCALADAVKSTGNRRIWLGLSSLTRSLRPYTSLSKIWDMVARSAYTQLNYSPWLLLGTVLGMILVYLVAPVAVILGGLMGNWLLMAGGLLIWLLMTLAYLPTICFYNCSPWFACCLPGIAFLYTFMTVDSAWRHWQGKGGSWKGRVYQ
ncbi:MAG: glycosyltransferase [Nostocaceae cyanobacterium]|nr:glycosyltransferase [Nostocaceae cyanobacterium]